MLGKIIAGGIGILFFGLTLGCGSAESFPKIDKIPDDLQITLERSACYGTCPDYSLSITADGRVVFEGRRFTKTEGKAETKVDQNVLKQIIAEFEKADFFKLKDRYVEETDGCGEVWTDNPSESISIKLNGKTKEVRHYFGCRKVSGNDLERITDLGEKIDSLVNSAQWVKEQAPEKK